MWLAPICGRRHLPGATLLVLLVAFPVFAGAQQVLRLQVAEPRTIVLPQSTIAGAPATLAVLDSAGRLLPNVAVELSGGQKLTTDSTGRAPFVVPGEPGVLTAQVPGHNVTSSAPIVKSADLESQTPIESL